MIITDDEVKRYKEFLAARMYSDNVKKNYAYYIMRLKGTEITQDNLNGLCQKENAHAVFRSFLKTLLKCFGLHNDYMIPPIRGRKPQKEIIYFTHTEIESILKNIKKAILHLMIRLMYEDGLRISEVINLKKSSFDMVNRRVRGMGKGNKEFSIRLQEPTYKLFQKYLENFDNDQYVFRWPDIYHQRQKALYELKKYISVILPHKQSKEIFCHAFRHSCGTHLREQGFDLREIQTYLRHEQLETVALYTAVDKLKLEKKIEGVF